MGEGVTRCSVFWIEVVRMTVGLGLEGVRLEGWS